MASGATLRITALVNDRASGPLKNLRRNLDNVDKGQSAAGSGALGMARAMLSAGGAAGALAIGAGVAANIIERVAEAVVDTGRRAIVAASDYNEALNKSQVLFGDSADIVKQFAETAADALGMTSTQALAATGAYGAMFKALGIGSAQAADMSVAMAKLAADMSSFNNIDPGEMLDKLRAGLSGESEPLRQVGVFLNEASVAQEAMLATGKRNAQQLTEQEKVLARYQLILKQTAAQQGDFARTADDPANAMRRITAGVEEIFRTVGDSLMPEVKPTLQSVMLLLKDFGAGIKAAFADPATSEFIHSLGEGIRAIIDIFRSLLPVLGLIFRAFVTVFGPVLAKAAQALKVVADVLRYFGQLVKSFIDWLRGLWQSFKSIIGWTGQWGDLLDLIGAKILATWEAFKGWIAWLLNLPTQWALEVGLKLPDFNLGNWKERTFGDLTNGIEIGIRLVFPNLAFIEWLTEWIIDHRDTIIRISIDLLDKASDALKWIGDKIAGLMGRNVPVGIDDQTEDSIRTIQSRIDNMNGVVLPISINDQTAEPVAQAQSAINAVTGVKVPIVAVDNATQTIQDIQSQIAAIQDKTVTVTTVNRTVNETTGQTTTSATSNGRIDVKIPGGVNVTPIDTQPIITSPAVGSIIAPANNLITSITSSLASLKDRIAGSYGGGGIGLYAMAAGGIVRGPTPALVGEAGPEAVIPLSQLGSMMGVGTVVINVSGYEDGAGAGAAAADAFRRALGLQRRMPFATV